MADALSRTVRARVRLIRDGADLYDQVYYDPDVTYTESTHQRLVLATSMGAPAAVDTGGVTSINLLFLQTDRLVYVGIDNQTTLIPVAANGALLLESSGFTSLYLQNQSSTNVATVELVVTD